MINLKTLLASSDQKGSLGDRFRNNRYIFFEELIHKQFGNAFPIRILDIGGMAYFWKDKELLKKGLVEITLLNLEREETDIPGLHAVSGDATNLSEYPDKSFDLVFSNSVIEHLYTWENQEKMAKEINRVGKKFWVQTPNRRFFIEAHYALPFAQYLPKKLIYFILTKTKLSRGMRWNPEYAQQYLDEIRLLTIGEMKELFPGAKMYKEKFVGMTKSVTAYNL
ncbi:class I SAM-dependent methyltransferase [Aquiflexum sp.]|uniref:class I SAM-dependent methyltransferase n=1 Tax=Aquiflexum sp. TaxID=1872584 RepID=UPI0035930217